MDRPRRTHAEARAQMRAGILRLGNQQLADVGASALSVREIARGIGVSSSAIYRHVADRDELLTLLLVDAYSDLADTVLHRVDPHDLPTARLTAIAAGMRAWALAHPARWALAYGSPVPGYSAPADQTNEPGTRIMAAFFATLAAGQTPRASQPQPVSPALQRDLIAGAAELGLQVDPELSAAALGAWTALIGLISAEVFHQFGPELAAHGAELLDRWLAETNARFLLP